MNFQRYAPVLIASLALVGCVNNDDNNNSSGGGASGGGGGGGGGGGALLGCEALDSLDLGGDQMNIVDLDAANLSPIVTDVFDRYTAITTPSGERIHVLAQANVSDARIRRARAVLSMHLENVPGSSAGSDKADVADEISGNCGTLAIFANEGAYDLSSPAVATFDADFGDAYVPLFGDSVILEGSPEYIQSSPAIDQTFSSTAVLVYRQGLLAQRPTFANQLMLASTNAQADGTFTPMGPEPFLNFDEEFLGIVMESHAGVWGHDPSGDGSAGNGTYAFGSRPEMQAGDASTVNLIESFFTPVHTFDAEIDPNFSGNFDLLFRESTPYSNRSQYLSEVRLTGSNNSELLGTSQADTLFGNVGNNRLRGRSGDDILDGGPGLDSAVFLAPRDEFTITDNGDGSTNVQHNEIPGLGTDTLRNFENIVFSDQTISI